MVLSIALVMTACKKQWDQRSQISNQQLNVNLMQEIQANGNLSTFAGYLKQFGYDKLLSSTKSYTVFAPTNTALQGVDQAIISDTAQLHRFVGNHIVYQAFFTNNTNVQTPLRLHNLIGKNITFTPTGVEDAQITTADLYVNNGVLHVIDKALTPRQNISEYLRSLTTDGQLQKAYILNNDTSYVDTSLATVASLDPVTGKPILVPGTGKVDLNKYFKKAGVAVANEDSTYTYFVLTDDGYNAELDKESKYFKTDSPDTTRNILTAFNVLKDVVVRGAVTPDKLTAGLVSVNGVPIPIDPSAIIRTYNASNGIVYVMSHINFNITDKITPITIEGEKASFYTRNDEGGLTGIRPRVDNNGVPYTDLFISGSGLPASYFAAYKLSHLYTCQYKVVWRAPNDTLTTKVGLKIPFTQRLTFGPIAGAVFDATAGATTVTTAVTFAYTTITPYNYNEVEQLGATATAGAISPTINVVNGKLNVLKYRSINMYAQGSTATATNTNDVLLDYVKLIPIIQ